MPEPNLVLPDLNLPETPGRDVVVRPKGNARLKHIPKGVQEYRAG